MGLSDLRAAGDEVAASPAAAIATLLLGVVLGSAGFLRYAARVASQNNELMLEAARRGGDVTTAMPVSATMLSSLVFALGTPLGLLATYLTLTGLVRSVAAAAGERRGDPVLALLVAFGRWLAGRKARQGQAREREALEGAEVADRIVFPVRLGIANADLVVVASRRKREWTPGTVLDCSGRWFRVGEPLERTFPVGLRTLYPLVEMPGSDVFRRVVPYDLPPMPPAD